MRIEIIDNNGNYIHDFESDCQPMELGQVLHITVSNNCERLPDVKEMCKCFTVEKIEYFQVTQLLPSAKMFSTFTASITVSEYE